MNKLIKYIIETRFNFNIDLLDIEDNESDFSLSKQLYKSKSMKEEYLENNLFVDLGLPSRTKWCKYNLGCDFDLLNSNPENTKPEDWYGKYYAWGEIKDKNNYDWDTYKLKRNIFDRKYNFVKYCTKSNYGYKNFTDDLIELLPEDDAAYQYNSSWRIPTKELFDELLEYTVSKLISGKGNNLYMNIKGLAGRLFTSKINGKSNNLYMNVKGLRGRLFTSKINGNQLFIPNAGYKGSSLFYGDDSICYLWSSSLRINYPDFAWGLHFDSGDISMDNSYRYRGYNVRPVC